MAQADANWRRSLQCHQAALPFLRVKPRFQIVLSLGRQPRGGDGLETVLKSVGAQIYGDWELVVLAAPSWRAAVQQALAGAAAGFASRVRLIDHGSALPAGGHDLVLVLDEQTLLLPHTLAAVARELQTLPQLPDFMYGDRGWIDAATGRVSAVHRPGWSPRLLAAYRYMSHPLLFSREALAQAGWLQQPLQPGFEWQWLDGGAARLRSVHRLPWLAGLSLAPQPREPAPAPVPGAGPLRDCAVVIPTRDQAPLLQGALASLRRCEAGSELDVLVVDNRSTQPAQVAAVAREFGARVLPFDQPFNYSAMNNWAVGQTRGRYLVLMNNDVELRTPHALQRMAAWAARPDVGAVGCQLLYGDDTIQHAGVLLSRQLLADHCFRGHAGRDTPDADLIHREREVSAVTAAFLMVEREKFDRVRGFDEVAFPIGYSDVDLCLRLNRAGLQSFYMGSVVHAHLESKSRGWTDEALERSALHRLYAAELDDPFFHPGTRRRDFQVEAALDYLGAGLRPLMPAPHGAAATSA